ncbi:hypothetical protein N7449_007834 [Penicillium cf. viridicatum]|uniref:Uncharacterized protein n=1 Tax=Penicillium cf. viridicatum TaxID=2972119 RepID=A0A9W9JLX1_9EURO|nr:hypothetical protein N7449_007834 [Penicillium cf. viridicatum]
MLGVWVHLQGHAPGRGGVVDIMMVVGHIFVLLQVIPVLALHARLVLVLEVALDGAEPGDVVRPGILGGRMVVPGLAVDVEIPDGEVRIDAVVSDDLVDGELAGVLVGTLEIVPGPVEGVAHPAGIGIRRASVWVVVVAVVLLGRPAETVRLAPDLAINRVVRRHAEGNKRHPLRSARRQHQVPRPPTATPGPSPVVGINLAVIVHFAGDRRGAVETRDLDGVRTGWKGDGDLVHLNPMMVVIHELLGGNEEAQGDHLRIERAFLLPLAMGA